MPQMMPLNWMMLLFFFISIFMVINVIFFFLKFHKISNMKMNQFKKNMNWKW